MSPTSFFNRHPRADLSAYLDGELSQRATRKLESHLATCPGCTAELEGLRETRATLRSLPEMPAPRSFTLTPEMARDARPARLAPEPRPLQPIVSGLRMASGGLAAALAVVVVIAVASGGNGTGEGDDAGSLTNLQTRMERAAGGDGADDGGATAPYDRDLYSTPIPSETGPDATLDSGSGTSGGGVGGVGGAGTVPTPVVEDSGTDGAAGAQNPAATIAPPGTADSIAEPQASPTGEFLAQAPDVTKTADDDAEAASALDSDDDGTSPLTIVAIVLAVLLGASVIGSIAASRLGQKM